MNRTKPAAIEVRGAKKNNLRNIDVDIPLGKIVGVAGVSGSGKSSLALGIVYAEGSRRYLESLSTYTRRRMTQAERAEVDDVRYVPAALALRQRPGVPGIRSTFGTSTELLNSLRLMYSRLASHRCPNGHYLAPSLDVAAERELVCPECGARFFAPGAEELAFNSQGACRRCDGTGVVREVDLTTIVPDDSLTIDQGAVAPWQSLMWSLMKDIARDHLGVRTDVPWRDLTDATISACGRTCRGATSPTGSGTSSSTRRRKSTTWSIRSRRTDAPAKWTSPFSTPSTPSRTRSRT